MQKPDHASNNSEELKKKKLPEEQKNFIKESKNAKVVPINEELECTLNHSSIVPSNSKRFSNLKNKLISFNSESMTTELNSRYTFIRNVFLLLFLQSVTSIIFGTIALKCKKIGKRMRNAKEFIAITLATLGFLVIMILFYRKFFKVKKLKWVLFTIFTIAKGFFASYISTITFSYDTIILHVIHCGICLSLAVYSIISKKDFENRIALLITLISCTFFFGISLVITQEYYSRMFYIYIGILLFSFFIVYDIQLIAGGRFHDFKYDDFAPTSLIVFVEIIGIIYYIAKLLFRSE